MALKLMLVHSACVALVLGAAIESRDKRQVPGGSFGFSGSGGGNLNDESQQSASEMMSGMRNRIPGMSEMQNGMQGFGDVASKAMNNMSNGAQDFGERLQNAFNKTYQEERNSVSDSFNSLKDQSHQNIETGANLTKTAFDLGTLFPKFGKNVIIGD